jgi:hypothetical protein
MSCIVELNVGDHAVIGSSALNQAYNALLTYPANVTFNSDAFGLYNVAMYRTEIVCLPRILTALGNYIVTNTTAKAVQIPDTVTSLGTGAISGCFGLSSLIIPSSVTSIGATCFQNNRGLGELHFKSTTPPTVANSNAFTNLPTDCKIYVPSGSLSAYTSAANYPSSSTYTYIEE